MDTKLERIQKDIETLAQFNGTPGNGLTRFSLSQEDKQAREYIKKEMAEAGLKVYEDGACTIVGRLEGSVKDAPAVLIGSHYDSVKNGGNFDGNAGVVAALETARVIKEKNIKLKHPVEFIAMIEEEGGRFGSGLFGSRAMAGLISREQLDMYKDKDGISIADAMRNFGFDPDKIGTAKRDSIDIKAFLELHIEQGPILEYEKKDIGIVNYIVGIKQLDITINGRSDHAGTTPMTMRKDALDGAAQIISKIGGKAKEVGEGSVATVGVLNILPGASNIVPGQVKFTVDIRSKYSSCINEIKDFIYDQLEKIKEEKELEYKVFEILNAEPVQLNPDIINCFNKNCEKLNFSKIDMLSGAGHDAMIMAQITDVGLLFVPSKGGRSHCPEEWTDYEDLQKGIEIMYNTVLDLGEAE